MSEPRVVVYSVNLGGYDARQHSHVEQTYPCDFVHYTSAEDLDISDARNCYEASKKWRMSAHKLSKVNTYDIAIYLDSHVFIKDPRFIQRVVDDLQKNKWDMLMSPHEERNTTSEEAGYCYFTKNRYSDYSLRRYIDKPSKHRLCLCGFNARWLTGPGNDNVNLLMDKWWSMILDDPYGIVNDQVVWPFALEYADKHFPIKFSCNWATEFRKSQSFYIHFSHTVFLNRQMKLPLINGIQEDPFVLLVLCTTNESAFNAFYNARGTFWVEVCGDCSNPLEQYKDRYASAKYVGIIKEDEFRSIHIDEMHKAIVAITDLSQETITIHTNTKSVVFRLVQPNDADK
jgi:hypothetical protein